MYGLLELPKVRKTLPNKLMDVMLKNEENNRHVVKGCLFQCLNTHFNS